MSDTPIPPKTTADKKLHLDEWNAIATWSGTTQSQATLLAGQMAGYNSGQQTLAQQATSHTTQLAQIQASLDALTASVGTIQGNQTSIQNRLTVLEKATPPPATPGAPTALHSTAVTTTSIAMALTAPVGGVAPDNYQWRIATPSGSGAWVNGALTGTTTTFSGLTPSTSYDIDAISVSTSAGPGGVSATYTVSTAAAPPVVTAPQAPTGLIATAVTTGSISMSAVAAAQGSPATSYHWEYRTPAGTGAYTSGPTGPTLPATISGLPSATPYGVRVTGSNSAGAGTPSAEFVTATATGTSVSADGTVIPPASQIIMADSSVITLSGGVVLSGGAPLGYSASVTGVGVFNGGVLYQQTAAGVWSWNTTTLNWDPSGTNPFSPVVINPPPPVTNPNVTIALGSPGAALSPYLWGFSTGALADNGWAALADARVRTSIGKLKPTLIRVNANEQMPRAYATGTTTIMDNLINNLTLFDPALRIVMGIGPTNGDTSVSAAQWGAWGVTFANHMRAIGHEIMYYEVGNECDGMALYDSYFNTIADALHGVNAAYKIGGTTASWWGGINLGTWASDCASRIGFGSMHEYPGGIGTSTATFYADALGGSATSSFLASMPAGLKGIEMGMLEANMSGDFNNPDARMGQITGAIYIPLDIMSNVRDSTNFTMWAMWDALYDGDYGAIGNGDYGGDPTQIAPTGWMMGISGQLMRGARVPVTVSLPNVAALAVKGANGFASIIVNYGNADQSMTLGVNGGTVGNAAMRQLTAATSSTTGPATVPLSSLTGITLPAQSVTWVTG